MPYLITTSRGAITVPEARLSIQANVLSRRAVATLEEARAEVSRIVAASNPRVPDTLGAIAGTGMIGPLPDGTVIEVTRIRWTPLMEMAGYDGPIFADGNYNHAIIDAYNAQT